MGASLLATIFTHRARLLSNRVNFYASHPPIEACFSPLFRPARSIAPIFYLSHTTSYNYKKRLMILYEPPQKTGIFMGFESQRVKQISSSPSLAIAMRTKELDIVGMSLGEPVCGAIS